jgi:cytochrome b involved in lipid metabolism
MKKHSIVTPAIAGIILIISVALFFALSKDTEKQVPVATANEITWQQLQKHATPQDCWTIINYTVYDLTPFFSSQPLPNLSTDICGKDGTTTALKYAKENKKEPTNLFQKYRIGIIAP